MTSLERFKAIRALPGDDPDPGRALAVATAVGVPLAAVSCVAGWFALAWTPRRLIVVLASAAAGPAAGLVIVLRSTVTGSRLRRRRALTGWAVVAAVLAVAVGWLLRAALPTAAEMRAALERADLPFRAVSGYRTAGSRLCNNGCEQVTRTYDLGAHRLDTEDLVFDHLSRRGWRGTGGADPDDAYAVEKGRLQIDTVYRGEGVVEVRVRIHEDVRPT